MKKAVSLALTAATLGVSLMGAGVYAQTKTSSAAGAAQTLAGNTTAVLVWIRDQATAGVKSSTNQAAFGTTVSASSFRLEPIGQTVAFVKLCKAFGPNDNNTQQLFEQALNLMKREIKDPNGKSSHTWSASYKDVQVAPPGTLAWCADGKMS